MKGLENEAHSTVLPLLHLCHRHFTYETAHSTTLPPLHLSHMSFYNPPVASPTSQALHVLHLASRPCIEGWKNSLWCTSLLQQVTKFRSTVERMGEWVGKREEWERERGSERERERMRQKDRERKRERDRERKKERERNWERVRETERKREGERERERERDRERETDKTHTQSAMSILCFFLRKGRNKTKNEFYSPSILFCCERCRFLIEFKRFYKLTYVGHISISTFEHEIQFKNLDKQNIGAQGAICQHFMLRLMFSIMHSCRC